MAIDPALIALIGSQLFSSIFGGGGGGQDRSTFEDEKDAEGSSIDPRHLLGSGLASTRQFGNQLGERTKKPVQLRSAYAQSPPTFSGGGLPIPIGVTGRDPARDDSSLLELPGLGNGSGASGGVDLFNSPAPRRAGNRTPGPDAEYTDRVAVPRGEHPAVEARAAVDLLMASARER